ncbi:MAG: type VI secretion system baseplate subunit TssG [Syntrophorhabdaceae bacterium]|nr:type VI secretion system baseplate subunit TssG [Syntrophorhabdaceae bacterium]
MAREDGDKTFDIKSELISNCQRFSFIQCYRILQHLIRQKNYETNEEELRHRIKVRPDLSLTFPENDIVYISEKEDKKEAYSITATFLGLYGTSSPLPTFYTEDLLNDVADDITITRDFFDIINIPVYHLFFKCWSKHRLFYQLIEGLDERQLDRIYSLAGLEDKRLRNTFEDPFFMLRYIGLITQAPRSAEGLRCMLADALNEPSVRIEELVERDSSIPEDQRFILGLQGHCLGENINLGLEITNITSQFNIHIGPVDYNTFQNLLPTGQMFKKIKSLIKYYLNQPLSWKVVIYIYQKDIKPLTLGIEDASCLGYNTWLPSMEGFFENIVEFQSY